jgi:hypothetical protein
MSKLSLREFLDTYVENYLKKDIRSLQAAPYALAQRENTAPSDAGTRGGGCGYPLLTTVCAGIELLGMLASDTPFNKDNGEAYFVHYWKSLLYRDNRPRAMTARGVYRIVRHGLAHSFVPRGAVEVINFSGGPHLMKDARRLVEGKGVVIINAFALGDDFIRSYDEGFLQEVEVREAEMELRLNEMWDEYLDAAYGERDQKTGRRPDKGGLMARDFENLPTQAEVDASSAQTEFTESLISNPPTGR